MVRARLKSNKKKTINYSSNIEEYVFSKFEKYMGKTQIEIYEEIYQKPIEKIPKNISKLISDKILGKDQDLQNIFPEKKFTIKNIPLTENHQARERMSFRNLRISDFNEEWEDSFWKDYFENTTFILICYAEQDKSRNGYRILNDIKVINFNDEELHSFKKTYNQTKTAINYEDTTLLPTPKSFEGQILEIAPKGQKGEDSYNTFFKEDRTRTCFMINKQFINKKLNE